MARNGRNPRLTRKGIELIAIINKAATELLELDDGKGHSVFYYLSLTEMEPLELCYDLVEKLDTWLPTRMNQGKYSQSQKLRHKAISLQEEANELLKRAQRLAAAT